MVKQNTEHHQCNLNGEPWDIVTKFIDGGIFVDLRRALKRYTMISRRHPLTESYAPSLSKFKEQETLHLIEHYSMIHPFSICNFHFNMIITIVTIFYMVVAPILYPFVEDVDIRFLTLIPLYIVTVTLIIISFYVGYHDMDRNAVIMNKWAVTKRYLKTYFFFDCLLFLPFLRKFPVINQIVQDSTISGSLDCARLMLRYVRYFWCLRNLNEIRIYYGFSTFAFKTLRIVLNVLVMLGLSMYCLYAVLSDIPFYEEDSFFVHITKTLDMFFLINHGETTLGPLTLEVVIPIIFILFGFLFHLRLLTEIMDVCLKYFSAKHQETKAYDSLNVYMDYAALPVNIRKKIYLYLEFKYQGQYYKQSIIRKATSVYLMNEIILAATQGSIQKVDLFYKMPEFILKKLGTLLSSEIYLPGDVIIKAGTTGLYMYFLLAGTVLVTSSNDKEICYLRDGAHFGEVALFINVARVANVIAATPCELFRLHRDSFWEVVKNYSTLWEEIESTLKDRIANASYTMIDSSRMSRSSKRNFIQGHRALE